MKQILLNHFKMRPNMQIQDMVKLIYQNEFAGGHFISGENDSLKRLQDEYDSVGQTNFPSIFEDIGNGLCRINLSALAKANDEFHVDISTVNKYFINTANSNCGKATIFKDKLNIFIQCCKEKLLPFTVDDVSEYLNEYKKQGYPPVSHSEIYKKAYQPAYRIVSSDFLDYYHLFSKIDQILKSNNNYNRKKDWDSGIFVAIDGNSGSGKSALSSLISRIYNCNVFHMDDFFLRPEQKTKQRMEETGGNVDYERFKEEVIEKLKTGQPFAYRKYDCRNMILTETANVIPKKLNIIEGSYSMHPTLIDAYDLKIFLHIGKEVQSRRIMTRNGADLYERFMDEWIPMENKYFKEFDIREKSDLVFP